MTCHRCNEQFAPDPDRVDAWANSGRPFEPTDWTCPGCQIDEWELVRAWYEAGLLDEDDLVDIDDFID